MQLPEGSILFIIIWGFVVFLLWNFYHFSRAFRKTTFVVLTGLATAALVGGIQYLQTRQQPPLPQGRSGILIFPFVEKSGHVDGGVNATGLAIAEMIGTHLQQTSGTPFYVIPTTTLFEVANRDSLVYIEYALQLARTAGLQVIGFGSYQKLPAEPANHHEDWSVECQLFDLRQTKTRSGIRLNLPERMNSLPTLAAETAAAILQTAAKNIAPPLPVIWQNQLAAESVEDFYAIKLALATNQTGTAALPQARRLWQADTSRAPWASLYVQTFLAQLRRQVATEKEWSDSLRYILPIAQRAAAADSLGSASARQLGEIFIRLKKWNDAEQALRLAHRRDSTDSKLYLLLAQLHASRWQGWGFQNELEFYQQARALNPLDVAAGLAAADCQWRENRTAPAIEILEHLLRLNPHHVEVLMSLGRIYVAQNNETKLFAIYEHILKITPDNADAYYNLGIAYYHHQDFDNALKFFERAIKLNDHADARLYVASIYERRGDSVQAIRYLRERIRLSHGDEDKYATEARYQLYKILLARGEIPAHLQPDSLK